MATTTAHGPLKVHLTPRDKTGVGVGVGVDLRFTRSAVAEAVDAVEQQLFEMDLGTRNDRVTVLGAIAYPTRHSRAVSILRAHDPDAALAYTPETHAAMHKVFVAHDDNQVLVDAGRLITAAGGLDARDYAFGAYMILIEHAAKCVGIHPTTIRNAMGEITNDFVAAWTTAEFTELVNEYAAACQWAAEDEAVYN